MMCFVCGFDFESVAPEERQLGSYFLCDCCCFEYMIDDMEYGNLMRARKKWISDGLPFGFELSPQHDVWTLSIALSQLGNLEKLELPSFLKALNPDYNAIIDKTNIAAAWASSRSNS